MNSRTWKNWSLLPHSLWQTVCIPCLMWELVCKSYSGLSSTLSLMSYSIFLFPKVTKVLNVTMIHYCTLQQSTCINMAVLFNHGRWFVFNAENLKKNIFLATPHSIWDFSSLTRAGTHASCIRRRNVNHWTTREDPTAKNFTTLLWASANMVNCSMLMRLPGRSLLSHFFSYCFGFDVKTFSQLLFRGIPFHDLHSFQPAHIISLH